MKMNESKLPSYLNELLTNHLGRYIDSNKHLIDENYDSELAAYVRNSKVIFET